MSRLTWAFPFRFDQLFYTISSPPSQCHQTVWIKIPGFPRRASDTRNGKLWPLAERWGGGARNLRGTGLADLSSQRPCFRGQLHALRLHRNLPQTGGVHFLPRCSTSADPVSQPSHPHWSRPPPGRAQLAAMTAHPHASFPAGGYD